MNATSASAEAFHTFWRRLQRNIRPGVSIPNWTAHGGFLGDAFKVTKCEPRYVEIESPMAQNIQHVAQREFEKVFWVWDDYVMGKLPRHQLRTTTWKSKYVISIIRHLGRQP